MAKLTIHDSGRSTIHEILDESVLVGKKAGAAVRISDPEAGAEHCQIRNVPGLGYKLIDLESQAGTKVNGAFVNQHLLRDGDVIQIGQVRIGFSGAGGIPVTPATPAAGFGAKPAGVGPKPAGPALRANARPAMPVRGAAMPARPRARPGPRPEAGEEWEERPRRAPRHGNNTPIIILGVVVGLLIFGLVIILAMGQRLEHNKTVYFDMSDMFRANRYQEAIALAADADPSGDKAYYSKIQQLEAECRNVMAQGDRDREERRIGLDYNKIEHFAKRNRLDKAAILSKWNEFIARHDRSPEPFHVMKAKQKRDRLMSSGAGNAGPVAPTGDGKIDRAWRAARDAAEELEKGDYFQKAINRIQDFWDTNQGLAAPGSGWDERVNSQVRAIESRARVQYEMIDGYAKQEVNRGNYPRAIEWYQRIIDRFGIEAYRVLAREAKKKL